MKKIYLFAVTMILAVAMNAQDKQLALVSSNLPADDAVIQGFMDAINAISGVTVTHLPYADYGAMTDFSAYDGIVLSENGSSSGYVAIGNAGWPIPVVSMKAYALYQGNNPILNQTYFTSGDKLTTDAILAAKMNYLVVTDNSSIFAGHAVGDSIMWCTSDDGTSNAHVQGMDFLAADGVPTAAADVAANAVAIAKNPYLENTTDMLPNFMWAIEENSYTKRVVTMGVHHQFTYTDADEFNHILTNAVLWSLKMDVVPWVGQSKVKANPFKVYPNPMSTQLNIDKASTIVSVEIIDLTGKVVKSQLNDAQNQIQINTSELVNGIYMMRLESTNGEVYTQKLVK